jgi:high-affinity Fe2+/Pb2+ permease
MGGVTQGSIAGAFISGVIGIALLTPVVFVFLGDITLSSIIPNLIAGSISLLIALTLAWLYSKKNHEVR